MSAIKEFRLKRINQMMMMMMIIVTAMASVNCSSACLVNLPGSSVWCEEIIKAHTEQARKRTFITP